MCVRFGAQAEVLINEKNTLQQRTLHIGGHSMVEHACCLTKAAAAASQPASQPVGAIRVGVGSECGPGVLISGPQMKCRPALELCSIRTTRTDPHAAVQVVCACLSDTHLRSQMGRKHNTASLSQLERA